MQGLICHLCANSELIVLYNILHYICYSSFFILLIVRQIVYIINVYIVILKTFNKHILIYMMLLHLILLLLFNIIIYIDQYHYHYRINIFFAIRDCCD